MFLLTLCCVVFTYSVSIFALQVVGNQVDCIPYQKIKNLDQSFYVITRTSAQKTPQKSRNKIKMSQTPDPSISGMCQQLKVSKSPNELTPNI